MKHFTHAEMALLRAMRAKREPMSEPCRHQWGHTRDEVVEALDALVRHPSNSDALEHVNRVLEMQAKGIPLVNGWEAWEIEKPQQRPWAVVRFRP